MSENKFYIPLKEITGSSALTRDAIRIIICDYTAMVNIGINAIEIDFAGIDSISRSFADELFKSQLLFSEKKHIEVALINLSSNIAQMLDKVRISNDPNFERNYSTRSNVQSFSANKPFKEYLNKLQ
jgi:hypothetical protein